MSRFSERLGHGSRLLVDRFADQGGTLTALPGEEGGIWPGPPWTILLAEQVGQWLLDETSGNRIDTVGDNDLVISGAVESNNGHSRLTVKTQNMACVPASGLLDPTTKAYAISLWFKFSGSAPNYWPTICEIADPLDQEDVLALSWAYTTGSGYTINDLFAKPAFNSSPSGKITFAGTTWASLCASWHNVVVGWSAADSKGFFALDGSIQRVSMSAPNAMSATAGLCIGVPTWDDSAPGDYSQLRCWSRGLTDAEIALIVANPPEGT